MKSKLKKIGKKKTQPSTKKEENNYERASMLSLEKGQLKKMYV